MSKEIKVTISGTDSELNNAICNLINSKLLGLGLDIDSTHVDQTIHVSTILINNKKQAEKITIKLDIFNE